MEKQSSHLKIFVLSFVVVMRILFVDIYNLHSFSCSNYFEVEIFKQILNYLLVKIGTRLAST